MAALFLSTSVKVFVFFYIFLCYKKFTTLHYFPQVPLQSPKKMPTILVTTCTGRKRVAALPWLSASSLQSGTQEEVLIEWLGRLKNVSSRTPAVGVYCGRGFASILGLSREEGCAVYVISAGLGLIPVHCGIPSYNLTISPALPESIRTKIIGQFDAAEWWRSLNNSTMGESFPLATLIAENSNANFLFSISRPYAEMVVEDLLSLSDEDLLRVRVVGLSVSDDLPERVRAVCMPYDNRFDGPDGCHRGTRSDFPQRAACHFLRHFYRGNEHCHPSLHAESVTNFLKGKAFPVKVQRTPKTDDQIRAIIHENWSLTKGTSAKMLRLLRDELLVSCEQKRFAQLFREVKVERNEPV